MVREDPFRSVIEGNPEFVGALDHIRIAQAAGGRDDGFDAGFGGSFDTVFKGEESVTGHDSAFQSCDTGIFFLEFDDRLFDGADPILFTGTDGQGLTVGNDDHAVGTDTQIDVPGEDQILLLGIGAFDGGTLFSAAAVTAACRNQIGNTADAGQQRSGDHQ